MLWAGCVCLLEAAAPGSGLPPYMQRDFDFSTFTKFEAAAPPQDGIYQSNGFLALQENGFGGQRLIIPAKVGDHPTNNSDRLFAIETAAPVITDSSHHVLSFADRNVKHSLSYYADRTVYRAAGENGLEAVLTVYPVFGQPAAVLKIKANGASGPIHVALQTTPSGLQRVDEEEKGLPPDTLVYGSSRWPIRLLVAGRNTTATSNGVLEWHLTGGEEAAAVIASGGTREQTERAMKAVLRSPDLLDGSTHQQWNRYLASVPLVTPAEPLHFTIGGSGRQETIAPEELIRSELWFWRGALQTTCQVTYLPACPQTIADWNVFMGMWSNDGIAEALALSATSRKDLARASILNWFRYAVNTRGDGTTAWTIFPSGRNTFEAQGPERMTQGIPAQATLVGEYIRLTGDTAILNENVGAGAGGRTLWQHLVAYQQNLAKIRDTNHDHLIDWLHTYETGWDDKNSPFFDLKGHATSAVNEQVFNLWSLQEMAYLSRMRGENPAPWQQEFSRAKAAVHDKLWDAKTQRYWDLDAQTGKLWTAGENLDAYYVLYYERNPARIAAMMERLHDPEKFDGALLPTLAFDTPRWGGYWRGPAWPRIFSYVSLGLSRSGQSQEAFTWLARAINSNLGPILPEHVDPRGYPPGEHNLGSVRIMGYDTLDCLVFPDIAGMRSWAGEDLTIVPESGLGKVYVRGQKWMGHDFDAVLEPGHPALIWQDGGQRKELAAGKSWRASIENGEVEFHVLDGSPRGGSK